LAKEQKTAHPVLNENARKTMADICDQVIKSMPIAANNQRKLMKAMQNVIATTDMRSVTGSKINEMAQEISDKSGVPIEQVKILLAAMTGNVQNTDMKTPTDNMMNGVESSIQQSSAPGDFSNLVSSLYSSWNNMSLADKETNITVWTNYAEKTAQRQGKAHGGGEIGPVGVRLHRGGEVPIIALEGEYMMQQSAVEKYGLPFMRAVNQGRLGQGEGGGAVHQHSWGPVYFPNVKAAADAEAIRDEMNRMAERAEDYKMSGGGY
jgi:hypothetical protein